MSTTDVHLRIAAVVGGRSIVSVAEDVGMNAETVRRQLAGGTLSLDFLIAFARVSDVRLDWLLLGQGHMRPSDERQAVLRDASMSELHRAMAEKWEAIDSGISRGVA
jgi:hypothetical protein